MNIGQDDSYSISLRGFTRSSQGIFRILPKIIQRMLPHLFFPLNNVLSIVMYEANLFLGGRQNVILRILRFCL